MEGEAPGSIILDKLQTIAEVNKRMKTIRRSLDVLSIINDPFHRTRLARDLNDRLLLLQQIEEANPLVREAKAGAMSELLQVQQMLNDIIRQKLNEESANEVDGKIELKAHEEASGSIDEESSTNEVDGKIEFKADEEARGNINEESCKHVSVVLRIDQKRPGLAKVESEITEEEAGDGQEEEWHSVGNESASVEETGVGVTESSKSKRLLGNLHKRFSKWKKTLVGTIEKKRNIKKGGSLTSSHSDAEDESVTQSGCLFISRSGKRGRQRRSDAIILEENNVVRIKRNSI